MFARTLALAAATAALTAIPFAADARPHAMSSDPRPGAVLKASPTAIRMVFSEGLARPSGLKLLTADGETLRTLPSFIGGPDNARMVVPLLAPLDPGVYTVSWQAVSDSARLTRGRFTFEIAP